MTDRPTLATERLELSLPCAEDMPEMMAIVSDEETGRFLGPIQSAPEQFNRFLRNAGSWLLYGYGGFLVREIGRPEVIGNCGIFHSIRGLGEDFDDFPEAGWIISSSHVGKGYASEAMQAVLDWFEKTHGARRVVCMIEPGNAPSIGLADKLGFAELRKATLPDGAEVILFAREP